MWNVRVLKAASLICVSLKTLQPLAVIGNKKNVGRKGNVLRLWFHPTFVRNLHVPLVLRWQMHLDFTVYYAPFALKSRTGVVKSQEPVWCYCSCNSFELCSQLEAQDTLVSFPPWRAWSVRLCRSSWAQLCKLQRGAQEQQRVQGTVETFTQEAGFNQNSHGKGNNEWMFVHLVEGEMRGGMETRQVYNCPLDWDFFNDSSLISAVLKEWD